MLIKMPSVCNDKMNACDNRHMQGLHGQAIDWSGVDGGWYSLIKDEEADIFVNIRATSPLPLEVPELITGVSVLSAGHSLIIEVKNPYDVNTGGCPAGISPCLAKGGLRALVDGLEDDSILRPVREELVVEGINVSACNLPEECRHFIGDMIWAHLYEDMMPGKSELRVKDTFADWLLRFQTMAAPDSCARYIDLHGLKDVQSTYAVLKIVTSSSTVHLDVGINYQGNGEVNWDGRVLPDMEFWQMNIGVDGLVLEHESLSGLLGETARPVMDENGQVIMHGYEAFRGTVEDYRVDGPLDTDFTLLRQ